MTPLGMPLGLANAWMLRAEVVEALPTLYGCAMMTRNPGKAHTTATPFTGKEARISPSTHWLVGERKGDDHTPCSIPAQYGSEDPKRER